MKRKCKDTITVQICGLNLWWDRKIKQHWRFIITVILVTVIVFGITGENVKIQTVSFIFMALFCLVRIYGSIINQRRIEKVE
jgi:4-hydroxybenzoate polyprenyltransferase